MEAAGCRPQCLNDGAAGFRAAVASHLRFHHHRNPTRCRGNPPVEWLTRESMFQSSHSGHPRITRTRIPEQQWFGGTKCV